MEHGCFIFEFEFNKVVCLIGCVHSVHFISGSFLLKSSKHRKKATIIAKQAKQMNEPRHLFALLVCPTFFTLFTINKPKQFSFLEQNRLVPHMQHIHMYTMRPSNEATRKKHRKAAKMVLRRPNWKMMM